MTSADAYDPIVAGAPSPSDSFILRFSELTEASPARPRDAVLRALDVFLSALFLLVFPSLVYAFLSIVWFLKMVQSMLRLR